MSKLHLFHFLTAVFFCCISIYGINKSIKDCISFKLVVLLFFINILNLWNLADSIINLGVFK